MYRVLLNLKSLMNIPCCPLTTFSNSANAAIVVNVVFGTIYTYFYIHSYLQRPGCYLFIFIISNVNIRNSLLDNLNSFLGETTSGCHKIGVHFYSYFNFVK